MLKELFNSYNYTIFQWFAFFYLYSLFGWIWEVPFIWVTEKRLENRGFMKGPFLPIYGSGAIMILVATLPFRDKYVLVFLFGLISATTLELCTGILMEKLFKMKYWDYTQKFLNFKGLICLESSIAWGAVSLLMMLFIHRPIEKFILGIPEKYLNPAVLVLTIVIAFDFGTSFKAALDLRDILVSFEKMKAEIISIQKKVGEVDITSFIPYNKSIIGLLKRNPGAVSREYKEALTAYYDIFIKRVKKTIGNTLDNIEEKIDDTKKSIGERIDNIEEKIDDTKKSIGEKIGNIEEKLDDKKKSIGETIGNFEDKIRRN